MFLLMVGIFAYREYRLTMYQDFQVHSEAMITCKDALNYEECRDKLKEYRMYFKYEYKK